MEKPNLFITITLLDRTLPHSAYIEVDFKNEESLQNALTKAAFVAQECLENTLGRKDGTNE
jgi:hypothetical protein